jgi:hypothetical protein
MTDVVLPDGSLDENVPFGVDAVVTVRRSI